ncbi:hypothetical protein CPB83DRAFT_893449 [Crepidotus variabilis]|uniref:Uncharacterized protein n=1 Tax=Crepidotus variabilis TaxID=179855 RepID=A0A9P6JR31_9AGAR|nr:hypothetical protein CPB83DRAFT_893449 [Crepidotus variabilis]
MPQNTPKRTFSNPIIRADIPPLKPEFRKSRDFLNQLLVLNDQFENNYVILPDGIPQNVFFRSNGISLTEFPAAVAFIAMRNRAMQYGDVDSLFYMYMVLKKYHDGTVMSNPVVEQLKKEFGEAGRELEERILKDSWPKVQEVTKEEIVHAIKWLKTTDRFTEELGEYNPDRFGETTLVNLEGGSDYRRPVISMNFPKQLLRIPLICLQLKLFNTVFSQNS